MYGPGYHFQNLHWKLGQLTLPFGSNHLSSILKNKTFLFFKIESWNFLHLFEIKSCETSQNFNSFSWFRQLLFSFFYPSSDWVEILWGFTKLFLKKILKDSVFYLKTKSFIQNKKASFTDPIFSKGFDHSLLKKDWWPKSTFLDSRGHFHQHWLADNKLTQSNLGKIFIQKNNNKLRVFSAYP